MDPYGTNSCVVLGLFAILLMRVYASAQTPDRITVLENFGNPDGGEPIFIYGQIASILDDSFLIMQISNPLAQLQYHDVIVTDFFSVK